MKTRYLAVIAVTIAAFFPTAAHSLSITQQAYLKASNTDAGDSFSAIAISGDTIVVGAPGEASCATGVNGDQSDNDCSYAGAAYVFVRDGTNWTQQAYLKPSNGSGFFETVAISGDTIVVGALEDSSGATGVNGDQNDYSAPYSGAAYVFVRNGTNWTQQAYLKASNTGAGDYFGYSVAISGDTVVIGADNESSSATGVNGNQSDDSAPYAGAAYVFVRNGTNWTQQAYLKASNTDSNDYFGSYASMDGDTIVVGAYGESSNATGVNGNQSDNTATNAGAAYVFVRNGTNWTQQAYLKASNTDAGDQFGISANISADSIVVGAPFEASKARGVNGNQSDNSAPWAGASYVFVRVGTTWTQQAYLKASNTDTGDLFGSAGISGDIIVAGAPFESSSATGVNGNQNNNSAEEAGAAYVFVRNGTNWTQQAYLKASNTDAGDRFAGGYLSGNTIVCTASREASSATGVNGDQSDNSAPDAGAVYVFIVSGAGGTNGTSLIDCSLSPQLATNIVGTAHTVTATVTSNGVAQSGALVDFNITSGPNVGQSGTVTTSASGQGSFTYNGSDTPGIDTIRATCLGATGTATKVWISTNAVHDLAVVKLIAPTKIKLTARKASKVGKFKVIIQNRGDGAEIIPDFATLANLVTLNVQSLGACPITPTLVSPKAGFPRKLGRKKKLTVVFSATFDCANDPLATTKSAAHNDYEATASVDLAALGEADIQNANDNCPRPPNPAIGDKGCGSKDPSTKELGAAVFTDVVVK